MYDFVDDHPVYLLFNAADQISQDDVLPSMQACMRDVSDGMPAHKLKVNDGKTESVIIRLRQNLSKLRINSVKVGITEIKPVCSLRSLRTMIYENLSRK